LLAGVVLLAFLLFGGFMISNSYAGALSSIMTIPRYEKTIDTTADVASSGLKLVGGTILWVTSLDMSEQPILVSIRNNFRVHDVDTLARFVHTRRDLGFMLERMQYGSYALESFMDVNASRLVQPLKEDLFWELVISACSKTWPLMGAYEDMILRVHQAGIQRYWELESVIRHMGLEIQRNIAMARAKDIDSNPVKLSMAHFLGVFFILFAGLMLAIITCVLEIIVYHAKTKVLTV
ncbi:uncharacterized protein LOC131207726, partial [Anopheles bellator]|uniref:uncharacterized protein LOC131207726 n=1 Tax=Anopheles bellator TaxID=139047 RepID=UPI0026474330